MMRLVLSICFVFTTLFSLMAQSNHPNRIAGECIVRLAENEDIQSFLRQLQTNQRTESNIQYIRPLGKKHNIHAISFDESQMHADDMLQLILVQRQVLSAQFNYQVDTRATPDDPFYEFQWHMDLIGMPEVWDVSTGGLTPQGDTIVVAVLDSGFDLSHPDLIPNIWRNQAEIPDDGIDNDNNGYIDDYSGWNFLEQTPEHRVTAHGTQVSGLLGARGDNGLGVTGVNWNVKLMLLNTRDVNSIVEAYEYVIAQRQLYNETNGEKGAFIVATNASFGIDRTYCSSFPVWEGMYDLMGEVGVLTGAGTSNSTYNVEEEGDIPSDCSSDFIITVLNTTFDDKKNANSAYGTTSIDMGSPGQGSYTIDLNDQYDSFGGNSAAAPHLSGAIAILYSIPCDSIAANAKRNPATTALVIRDILLRAVDPVEELSAFTATGGRLNVANAVEIIQETCGGTTAPLDVIRIYPNPSAEFLSVEYETPGFSDYRFRVVNMLGQTVIKDTVLPPQFGFKRYQIDVRHLAAGTYFFVIDKGLNIEALPFVKM